MVTVITPGGIAFEFKDVESVQPVPTRPESERPVVYLLRNRSNGLIAYIPGDWAICTRNVELDADSERLEFVNEVRRGN